MQKRIILSTIALFFMTSLLSIYAAQQLIEDQVKAVIVNENPEAIENSIGIIAWILIFTIAILVTFKILPDYFSYSILKIIETIAILASTTIILYPTKTSFEITLIIGLLIAITKNVYKENRLVKNVSSTVAVAGASAIIGVSIGIMPAITLMMVLAVYDYLAVFKTKHMIELAKKLSGKNLAFTYEIPSNGGKYELGTGDIVIPLIFAISVMHEAITKSQANYLYLATIILIASLSGLIVTLEILAKQKKPLPALPLQVIYMIIAFTLIKATNLL